MNSKTLISQAVKSRGKVVRFSTFTTLASSASGKRPAKDNRLENKTLPLTLNYSTKIPEVEG